MLYLAAVAGRFLLCPPPANLFFRCFLPGGPCFTRWACTLFLFFLESKIDQRDKTTNVHVSTRTHCPSHIDNTHKRTQTPKKKKGTFDIPKCFVSFAAHANVFPGLFVRPIDSIFGMLELPLLSRDEDKFVFVLPIHEKLLAPLPVGT